MNRTTVKSYAYVSDYASASQKPSAYFRQSMVYHYVILQMLFPFEGFT